MLAFMFVQVPRLPPENHLSMISCQHDAKKLETFLSSLGTVVVAFSGGVDSSVVAAAAHRAKPGQSLAVTADSPSVPHWQLQIAKKVAEEIGIEHRIVRTDETSSIDYRRNDRLRCFYCKGTLYEFLRRTGDEFPDATILSGTNADDMADYRPGIDAGSRKGVVTPLANFGFRKTKVRELAKHYQLSNHALPASPCLASRIAYGTEVTPERLHRIEQAEDRLRELGFVECRVRLHANELARIEVSKDQIFKLIEIDQEGDLTREFQELGFTFVSVDLAGFQSGSMNRVLVSISDSNSERKQEALD